MSRPTPITVASLLVAVLLSAASLQASAATLSVSSTDRFLLSNLGVVASVGASPIPPAPYPGLPTTGAVIAGTMTVDPVDALSADLSFSFAMFSDAEPLIVTGSYGDSAVPVTLRINELRYETPSPVRVAFGAQAVAGAVNGTLRGTLTVGTEVAAFELLTSSGWYSDGAICAGCLDMTVGLDQVVLGLDIPGGGIASGLGVFPAADLLTVDGVTFGLPALYPEFYAITYVPEPGAAALLAVAAVLALGRRMSARHRSSRCACPGGGLRILRASRPALRVDAGCRAAWSRV